PRRATRRPGVALTLDPQARPALDSGGNPDRDLAGPALAPLAAAIPARLLDDASRPAANRARPRHHEKALREPLASPASAGGARLRTRSPRGAGSRASLAPDLPGDLQRRLHSKRGVPEGHLHPVNDVAAGGTPGRSAAEAREAEKVLEEIGEIAEDRGVESAKPRRPASETGVAEPV